MNLLELYVKSKNQNEQLEKTVKEEWKNLDAKTKNIIGPILCDLLIDDDIYGLESLLFKKCKKVFKNYFLNKIDEILKKGKINNVEWCDLCCYTYGAIKDNHWTEEENDKIETLESKIFRIRIENWTLTIDEEIKEVLKIFKSNIKEVVK